MRATTLRKQPNSANPYIFSENASLRSEEKVGGVAKNMINHKKKAEQFEKFKKAVEQAAHDIRTPLQTLSMALTHCFKSLTEEERMLLNNLTNSIKKIAQVLLESTKEEESADHQYIQISQVLAEIVKQKEIQYIGENIVFKYSFDPALNFTFIHGNALNFERMVSNLINNSVEAFDGKQGIVKVGFTTEDNRVKLTIEDNGIGMPQEIADKLMRGDSISTTKKDGHSIGTNQIREALKRFNGTQLIESTLNVGTKITLIIPKSESPKWAMGKALKAKEDLHLPSTGIVAEVVILDDSKSFVEALSDFLQSRGVKKIDTYCSPDDLLKNLSKYPVNTKIFMDNDFKFHVSGNDLAKQLTMQGFKKLHILSGSPAKSLRSKYPYGIKFIEKESETFMNDIIHYVQMKK